MKNLLVVSSSPNLSQSYSRRLSYAFADKFRSKVSGASVVIRDLGKAPIAHLDELTIGSFYTPPDQQNEQQQSAVTLSNDLIAEVNAADVIVIGSPMQNFGISSSLKAYFDQIIRAGLTFSYTANGAEGLLKDKKVYVLTARGSNYSHEPMNTFDYQEPYLRHILGFIGLYDVEFIHCQGVSMGEESIKLAIDGASARVDQAVNALAA